MIRRPQAGRGAILRIVSHDVNVIGFKAPSGQDEAMRVVSADTGLSRSEAWQQVNPASSEAQASTKPTMQVWNADQLRRFLEAIEAHQLCPAFYLKANSGMRRGEVLGLTWKNIDLETARISVTQTVLAPEYRIRVSDVKTPQSRRTIDLDPRTIVVMRAWRKRQLEHYLQSGTRSEDSGFVFAQPNGEPLHPDFFSQTFERLLAKTDLPRIRLHDLRHTHATLLIQAGVPIKVVTERLGHATPAFTMSVYQHVLPGMQADAAVAFSDVVFGELRGEQGSRQ